MKISNNDKARVDSLISICKNKQGEYLPEHHGSGSWATTYSNEFINSAAEIFTIFNQFGRFHALKMLSDLFKENGIKSCRGSVMDFNRVEYLYETHLCQKVENLHVAKNEKLNHDKTECEYCQKMVVDLTQHISQGHPEKWSEYSKRPGVIEGLKGKVRCPDCGSFLKKIDGHSERCILTISN